MTHKRYSLLDVLRCWSPRNVKVGGFYDVELEERIAAALAKQREQSNAQSA